MYIFGVDGWLDAFVLSTSFIIGAFLVTFIMFILAFQPIIGVRM